MTGISVGNSEESNESALSKSFVSIISTTVSLLVFVVLVVPQIAYAHPGRTDSSGGHTCRTNCESWGLDYGEYHYHNGGGGGTSSELSEAAQARVAGADFAQTDNRARIESSASVEGTQQGNTDGLAGTNTAYEVNDSTQHCSQDINFTNPVSTAYKEAFQTIYTRTCISVYNDAYRAAYQTANLKAIKTYEANKAKELAAKNETNVVSNENSSSWLGWLVLGGFIGLPLIGASLESIKKK